MKMRRNFTILPLLALFLHRTSHGLPTANSDDSSDNNTTTATTSNSEDPSDNITTTGNNITSGSNGDCRNSGKRELIFFVLNCNYKTK